MKTKTVNTLFAIIGTVVSVLSLIAGGLICMVIKELYHTVVILGVGTQYQHLLLIGLPIGVILIFVLVFILLKTVTTEINSSDDIV